MCHIIELIGGLGDGISFDVCEMPPLNIAVWHDHHADVDDCTGTTVLDLDNTNSPLPSGVEIVVYRRRWTHVLSLKLPDASVVRVPYDLTSEPAQQHIRTE